MGLTRRMVLGGLPVLATPFLLGGAPASGKPDASLPPRTLPPPDPVFRKEWDVFASKFLTPDGRVMDTGNVSHSEGQGWGMLFAVEADDRDAFDRIHVWTKANLGRGEDSLHSWRFTSGKGVEDKNNASDGDIYLAWALWRAARRWGNPDHAAASRAIASDILRLLVRDAAGRTLLLPGQSGFEHAGTVDVNPSYYCFPALAELSEAVPSNQWVRLRQDGVDLVSHGRFGKWRLPPDWFTVHKGSALAPSTRWPARFSFDAVRVPLFLAWSGLMTPDIRQSFLGLWGCVTPMPAWVNLHSGETSPYGACPGVVGISMAIGADFRGTAPDDFPSVAAGGDYYSSALLLLGRMAWGQQI